jgi:Icc-related predicted phosphoesterase
MVVQTDLYTEPTIAMSDIHSHTAALIDMLQEYVDISQCTVITAGDMAGNMVYGSDGDPTEDLLHLNLLSREFYYVHGNHDVPNKHMDGITNAAGKRCAVPTVRMAGVDGTISNKSHVNKFPRDVYLEKLERVLKMRPWTLVTHETPAIPKLHDSLTSSLQAKSDPEWEPNLIGNMDVYKIVNKYKPKVHIYGHCHHPCPFYDIGGVHYVNVDARVIIFVPSEEVWDRIKK